MSRVYIFQLKLPHPPIPPKSCMSTIYSGRNSDIELFLSFSNVFPKAYPKRVPHPSSSPPLFPSPQIFQKWSFSTSSLAQKKTSIIICLAGLDWDPPKMILAAFLQHLHSLHLFLLGKTFPNFLTWSCFLPQTWCQHHLRLSLLTAELCPKISHPRRSKPFGMIMKNLLSSSKRTDTQR